MESAAMSFVITAIDMRHVTFVNKLINFILAIYSTLLNGIIMTSISNEPLFSSPTQSYTRFFHVYIIIKFEEKRMLLGTTKWNEWRNQFLISSLRKKRRKYFFDIISKSFVLQLKIASSSAYIRPFSTQKTYSTMEISNHIFKVWKNLNSNLFN